MFENGRYITAHTNFDNDYRVYTFIRCKNGVCRVRSYKRSPWHSSRLRISRILSSAKRYEYVKLYPM
jgi:hypothetical protein